MTNDKPPINWWERVSKAEVKIDNLEDWQERQNGSLKAIAKKMDNIHSWLMGIMGGLIISLIMMILNFVTKGNCF